MVNPWKKSSQVSPQLDLGYLQISNEVLEALMRSPLSGAELRLCLAIIRTTWGWQKTSDAISFSQLVGLTDLSERQVKRSIKSLRSKRVVFYKPSNHRVSSGSPLNEYLFNKYYDTWIQKGEKPSLKATEGDKTGQKRVSSMSPTKDMYTKESSTTLFKKAVRYWHRSYQKKFGYPYDFKKRKDGAHVKRLFKLYGPDVLNRMIDSFLESNDKWIKEEPGRYTLGVLRSRSNQLIQSLSRGDDAGEDSETQPKGFASHVPY